jgi:pentalenene oxygenase
MRDPAPVSPRTLARDPLGTLADLRDPGGTRCLSLGEQRVVLVSQEEALGQMLVEGHRAFAKANVLTGQAGVAPRTPHGSLIASDDPDRHLEGRRLVQPVFAASRLPAYARTMQRLTDDWIDGIEPGRPFEAGAAMHALGCRIALETVFDGAFDEREAAVIEGAARDVLAAFTFVATPGVVLRELVRRPLAWRRARRASRTLHDVVSARLRAAKAGHGLLALLADSDHARRGSDVASDAVLILLAATETTANALVWALLEVAERPQLQAALREEAAAAWDDRAPEEALEHLPLTASTALEALRLHPPSWYIARSAREETEIGGHQLRPGDVALALPYLEQRAGERFADAGSFEPQRWSQPPAERVAFFPFGAGPRRCAGERIARMQMTLVLSLLCLRLQLRRAASETVAARAGAALVPDRAVPLVAEGWQ